MSCDCTVTLNAVPAVPVLGTVVYKMRSRTSLDSRDGRRTSMAGTIIHGDCQAAARDCRCHAGATQHSRSERPRRSGHARRTAKVTVEVKPVAVMLFASSAVIVVMLNDVPAVCGEEIDEIAKLLTRPGLTVKAALFPVVRLSPLVRVAVRTTPLSAFV